LIAQEKGVTSLPLSFSTYFLKFNREIISSIRLNRHHFPPPGPFPGSEFRLEKFALAAEISDRGRGPVRLSLVVCDVERDLKRILHWAATHATADRDFFSFLHGVHIGEGVAVNLPCAFGPGERGPEGQEDEDQECAFH